MKNAIGRLERKRPRSGRLPKGPSHAMWAASWAALSVVINDQSVRGLKAGLVAKSGATPSQAPPHIHNPVPGVSKCQAGIVEACRSDPDPKHQPMLQRQRLRHHFAERLPLVVHEGTGCIEPSLHASTLGRTRPGWSAPGCCQIAVGPRLASRKGSSGVAGSFEAIAYAPNVAMRCRKPTHQDGHPARGRTTG